MATLTGVRTRVELGVTVPNQPGRLAGITTALHGAGVDLKGVMTVHAGATARVKLLAGDDDGGAALGALEELGYAVSRTPVFALEGSAESGLALRVINRLADAGVNIVSCYSVDLDGMTRFVIAVDRPDLAAEVLADAV